MQSPAATANEESDDEDGPLWEPATLDDSAPFYAWIAAETKVTMKPRRYLVNECGLPKQYVTSMGYWRQDKTTRQVQERAVASVTCHGTRKLLLSGRNRSGS